MEQHSKNRLQTLDPLLFGKIQSIRSLSGGSVSEVFHLKTTKGDFCAKLVAKRSKEQLVKEKEGLEAIGATNHIACPKVIGIQETATDACLILEYIPVAPHGDDTAFARSLAAMHRETHTHFGWESHNYMGGLIQHNQRHDDWESFFVSQRLEPQFALAYNQALLDRKDRKAIEKFWQHINDFFPTEPPALVHGDLWSGNYLFHQNGKAYLIDPAVHYGHREVDLAMSHLFGGFSEEFYSAYQEQYPMEANWASRMPFYQLYPILIHINLFGGGYTDDFRRIVKAFY